MAVAVERTDREEIQDDRRSDGARFGARAIENRPIERLVPYARNARTQSEAQVALIVGSIREGSLSRRDGARGEGTAPLPSGRASGQTSPTGTGSSPVPDLGPQEADAS